MIDGYSLFEDFCPCCGSLNLVELAQPKTSRHHAQLNCADCQSFVKWVKKPKTTIPISRLLQNNNLAPWERKFLKSIVYDKPTQSESIVLKAIQAKVDPACNDAG